MGNGKKKIEIKKIEKESARMVTFSKRRQGLFKKAHQLQSLTGAKIAILVFSPAGRPFIHGDVDTLESALLNASTATTTTAAAGHSGDIAAVEGDNSCTATTSGCPLIIID